MESRLPIITIDGPAGVGKTTIAANVASSLDVPCLDTGAMFRYLALRGGPEIVDFNDARLKDFCKHFHFNLAGSGSSSTLFCDGQPLGPGIRTEQIGALASRLAKRQPVREYLLKEQRHIGEQTPLVAEGRDMGTVVFPLARFKFFLIARPDVRAERRWRELEAKGQKIDLHQLAKEIEERDEQDRNRAIAPLKPAPDAIIIDTSDLSASDVLAKLLALIRESCKNFPECPQIS